jgi:hypothetical protein
VFRTLVLTGACLALGAPAALTAAQGGPRHPHLHQALFELRESRNELRAATHNYGGHRQRALEATEGAIRHIELALRAKGDNTRGTPAGPGVYGNYRHHPHIHHAIAVLAAARGELLSAAHDFGGHREAAVRDINAAIGHLEACLRHVRK